MKHNNHHHQNQNEKGEWEKYTKGIGSKLLEKMGYKGGALGKGGLSKPIEVVKLPDREGLGYSVSINDLTTNPFENDFHYHTANFQNKQRAYNDDENDFKFIKKHSIHSSGGTDRVKQWKDKASKPKIIYKTADEVLKNIGDKQVIIDMRSGNESVYTANSEELLENESILVNKKIRCAELRYNTNLLVDYSKMQMQNLAKKIEFQTTTLNHLTTQHENISKLRENDNKRIKRLNEITEIISKSNERLLKSQFQISQIITMFELLKENYTTEFYQYRLYNLSIPMLFPQLKQIIQSWNPFTTDEIGSVIELLESLQSLFDGCENFIVDKQTGDFRDRREGVYFQIIEEILLPRLNSLFINHWHPRDQYFISISLLSNLQSYFPPKIFDSFVELVLIPKLKFEIDHWSPSLSLSSLSSTSDDIEGASESDKKKSKTRSRKKETSLEWLFSWSSLLMSETFLPLVITTKQKVQKYLQSKLNLNNLDHYHLILSFRPHLKLAEFHSLLLYTVSPKISLYFQSSVEFSIANPSKSVDLVDLHSILKWCELLSPKQFVDILEAHFFPRFLQILYNSLHQQLNTLLEIKDFYSFWKSLFQHHEFLLIERIRHHFYQSLYLISNHLITMKSKS